MRTKDTYLDKAAAGYGEAYAALLAGDEPRALACLKQAAVGLSCADILQLDQKVRWSMRTVRARVSRFVRLSPETRSRAEFAPLLIHDPEWSTRLDAVENLVAPERDALRMTALLVRCNDWVEPVRAAARQRVAALADQPLPVLSEVLPILLRRVPAWQRGGAEAASLLSRHPDWHDCLLEFFLTKTSGPLARLLREALADGALDEQLERLANEARSAFVRSVAAEAVLSGQALWMAGREWVWIDKSMGERRRRPVWHTRKLAADAETWRRVLQAAGRDRSALVRKIAADALIVQGARSALEMVEILKADKSRAVRDRMEYFERKWLATAPAQDGKNDRA